MRLLRGVVAVVSLASFAGASAAERPSEVRLYALDCGRIEHGDLGAYSDTGEYDGKPGALADPCFLIAHPKGWLLWDTGLGDGLVGAPQRLELFGGTKLEVARSLVSQLQQLGLAPGEIDFVSFSHFHLDHTGNANLFTNSTWILRKAELDHALSQPTPLGVVPGSFSLYAKARVVMAEADHDVFGDGKVKILSAPGHTPGHQILLVRLARSGPVILSGDLYHLRASVETERVPVHNTSRAETLASMRRVQGLIKTTHARLVVQHDPEVLRGLPRFPAFLE